MPKKLSQQKLERIIDVNYNRAKEGLRVCEDIARFVFDDKALTGQYKKVRHGLTDVISVFGLKKIVAARDIAGDVGRKTISTESKRKDLRDIFYANAQRAKESLRVLEEFAKLMDVSAAERIKRLRYLVYTLEKQALRSL